MNKAETLEIQRMRANLGAKYPPSVTKARLMETVRLVHANGGDTSLFPTEWVR